ncbi:MAG: Dephospho-CoA kinase [Bryobacterales bacterium]|nr:Dephospho-CoA kinase [Bryobacterales bacterium]
MLIAGLTGGLASGKSFVAAALQNLGAHVIEADQLGHEVLAKGGSAFAPVVEAFGPTILGDDGDIDRARLGKIVFSDEALLEKLTAIVHPAVHSLAQQRFAAIAQNEPHAIVIYIAAILVETGGYKQFPWLIVTRCTREQQIERALRRPGATRADVEARLARQLPLDEKIALATHIVDTGGTCEETLRQTKMVYEDLRNRES